MATSLPPLEATVRLMTQGFFTEIKKVTQALNQLQQQTNKLATQTQAIGIGAGGLNTVAQGIKNIGSAANQTNSVLSSTLSFFTRIATFTVATGVIVRGFFAITGAIKDTVAEGIHFNATMETGALAIAGILGATRQVVDAQGQVIEITRSYPFLLEQAKNIQKDILLANIETLGTGEELMNVYAQVLASSAGQKAEMSEILELAKLITNVGKIRGLQGEQLVTEARQILTLETARGQQVLQTLGVTVKQAREYQKQGTLIQFLIEKGAAFNVLASQLGKTWEGVTSTLQTFFSMLAGQAFSNTFAGMKEIILGIADAFDKASKGGGIAAALNLTPAQLRDLGSALGEMTVDFVTGIARATNATIEFVQKFREAKDLLENTQLADSFGGIADLIGGILSTSTEGWGYILGYVVLPFVQTIAETIVYIVELIRGLASASATLDFSGPLAFWESLKNIDFTAINEKARLAAEQAGLEWTLAGEQIDTVFTGIANKSLPPFVAAVGEASGAIDAASVSWSIINKEAKSGPSDAEIRKAEQAAVDLDKFLQKAAESTRKLAEETALANGDIEKFAQARQAEIEAETRLALDQAQKQGVLAKARIAIFEEERNKRIELSFQIADAAIKNEQKISAAIEKQIELQHRLRQAQLEAKDILLGSQAGAIQQELDYLKEKGGTLAEQIRLTKELGEIEVQRAQNALDQINDEIQKNEELIKTYNKEIDKLIELESREIARAIAAGATNEEIIAIARRYLEAIDEQTNKVKEAQAAQEVLGAKATAAGQDISNAAKKASRDLEEISTTTIHWGDVIRDSVRQVFDALVAGTLDLKEAFKSLGLAIAGHLVDAFAEVLAKKLGFDTIIKNNVAGIGGLFQNLAGGITSVFSGILGAVGGNAGQLLGGLQVMGSGVLDLFQGISGAWKNISGGLVQTFKGLGPSVTGFLGGLAGKGVNALFGIGETPTGALGSNAGGLAGGIAGQILGQLVFKSLDFILPGLGSLLGVVLGGVIGDLFTSLPTKGTQIRQGIEKWLKEIGVSFAGQVSEKNYFFKETKELAKQMFGGDFLAASKEILKNEAGPELAKELQALGTFLTADSAMKLKKPIEQTATTFGNMLVDSLGVEKVPEAVQEILEKGGISFEAVVNKINEVFEKGKISADFYKDAIIGTVSLFTKDLPEGIDIAKVAMESFGEDGLFSLEKFQAALEQIVIQAEGIAQAFTGAISQGLQSGQSRAEVEAAFESLFKDTLRAALIDKFMAETLPKIFEGIDLTKPLVLGSEEMELLKTRTGDAYDQLLALLDAAGLLPDAFKEATDEAGKMAEQLIDVPTTLRGALEAGMQVVIDAISEGISSSEAIAKGQAAFEQFFQEAMRNAIIQKIITESIGQLLEGLDLTKPLDLSSEAFQNLKNGAGAVYENILKILEVTGLLPEAISDAAESTKDTADATQEVADANEDSSAAASELASSLQEVLTSAGLTADAVKTVQDQLAAAGLSGGDLSATMQEILTNAGLAAPEVEAIKTLLAEAGLSGMDMASAMQEVLTNAGLTAPEIEKVKQALENAALSGTDMVGTMQEVLESAGLTTPEIEDIKDALGEAGISGTALNESLKNALQNLLPMAPTIKETKENMDAVDRSVNEVEVIMKSLVERGLDYNAGLTDSNDIILDMNDAIDASVLKVHTLTEAFKEAAKEAAKIKVGDAPTVNTATGEVQPKARGGLIGGSGNRDSVLALLTPGEFVINKRATQENLALLAMLNSGMEVARFQRGGTVGEGNAGGNTGGLFRGWTRALGEGIQHLFDWISLSRKRNQLTEEEIQQIEELNKQIKEITNRRSEIAISLAEQIESIGGTPAVSALNLKTAKIQAELAPLMAKFVSLTVDELKEAESLTNELRSVVVQRYQDEAQAIQDASQKRLDALEEELRIAEEFQSLSKNLEQTLTQLLVGQQSIFSPGQQFGMLQLQAQFLRDQIATAPLADKAALIQELSGVLQSMLGLDLFQKPSAEYEALFLSVVSELQSLKGIATDQGGNVDDIQDKIAIEIEQTTVAIDTLRTATITQLQTLAAQEDRLAAAQQQLLQRQIDEIMGVGGRQTETNGHLINLLTGTANIGTIFQNNLKETNSRLASIDANIRNLANAGGSTGSNPPFKDEPVVSAQSGFYGGPLAHNQMFYAHRGEYVNIGHEPGGNTINFAPVINVTATGSSDPSQIGSGISAVLVKEYQTGRLGHEIRKDILRKR